MKNTIFFNYTWEFHLVYAFVCLPLLFSLVQDQTSPPKLLSIPNSVCMCVSHFFSCSLSFRSNFREIRNSQFQPPYLLSSICCFWCSFFFIFFVIPPINVASEETTRIHRRHAEQWKKVYIYNNNKKYTENKKIFCFLLLFCFVLFCFSLSSLSFSWLISCF